MRPPRGFARARTGLRGARGSFGAALISLRAPGEGHHTSGFE
ncbi:hypothetical protein [Streptomyces formicae]|nr:hypothetical protein [Streptomyces formicae]